MNFIIFDLEFNQLQLKNKTKSNTDNLKQEIIQLGALKVDKNLEIISTFNTLIKPTVNTTIHPYIENLTNITNEKVLKSPTFPQVYDKFLNFLREDEHILCVWGKSDIKELFKNIRFHNLSHENISNKYIDIQHHATKYFNLPKGCKISLINAIECLNINITNPLHDAYNDTCYTYEVFKKINNSDITPLTYNFNSSKREISTKTQIDITGLLNQFKKMYNKQLTEEEISMIKLAYKMGATKQFLLK